LVIANKMDLAQAQDHLARFRVRFPELTVIPVSAKQERGISQLKSLLGAWIPAQPGLARSAQADFSAVHD
jgi:GTP-binding protein